MDNDKQSLTAAQVKAYLINHPDFLLKEPAILEQLQLGTSAQGVVSLVQLQTDRLKNKNQQLQAQLSTLIANARQNTELQTRIHQLCLRLMDAPSFGELLPLLMSELKQQFTADEVALRWFYQGATAPELPDTGENIIQQHADSEELTAFATILAKGEPVCGRLNQKQKKILFAHQANKVRSVVCLPLGHDPCAGLLAIASYDEARFDTDMATDYLRFLGEIALRLLRPHRHG